MKLAQMQAQLWRAIAERQVEGVDGIVQAGVRLTPERRIDIYAQMYFWRQVDALKEDFPKLAALLGDDAFAHLVQDYVQLYPSEHPSLGRLGRKLAQFISQRAWQLARPDLADLAALEWARAEVFVERDAAVAPATAFAELPPESFPQAKCHLAPAMRVLSLQHDVTALWRAIEDDGAVPEPTSSQQQVLVWRKGWAVYHAAIDPDEGCALERARQGRSLGEICEAFAEREEPAAAAFTALQSWLGEGLVSSVERA